MIEVFDSIGCSKVNQIKIPEPDIINAAISELESNDCNNISLMASVSGGIPPYTYLWPTGSTDSFTVVNENGLFEILIKDNVGCSVRISHEIFSIKKTNATCDDDNPNTINDVYTENCQCIGTVINGACPTIESTINRTICQGTRFEGYNESGQFTDVFLTANGCDSVRTLNLEVIERIVTQIDTSLCLGQSVEGYIGKGSYIDVFSSVTGCDSLRILSVLILPENNVSCLSTSTIDIEEDNTFSIYPNPINDHLTISVNASISFPYTISIFSSQGKLIDSFQIHKSTTALSTAYLQKGIYTILIKTTDNSFVKRLIKI